MAEPGVTKRDKAELGLSKADRNLTMKRDLFHHHQRQGVVPKFGLLVEALRFRGSANSRDNGGAH